MIIPAAPDGKPAAVFDTECYINFWLLKIRPQGGAVITFALRDGARFGADTQARIYQLLQLFTMVSFNGIYYDVPMISGVLAGYTTEQLKWLNDKIIVEGLKPWELESIGLTLLPPQDHIDIIEVAPGAGSQKQCAGRIHYKTMRDLPYSPDSYLDAAQIQNVSEYCENDLEQLEALFDALRPQISVREELGKRYGIDLRSKSDAQMGEAIIKTLCERETCSRIYKPDIDWNLRFRYEPPQWLSFQTPALRDAFEIIKASIFELDGSGAVKMPKQLEGLEIPFGKSVYRLGIGGLHSSEKRRVYRSDETHVIRDVDVASYYPNLILNSGRYPLACGPVFQKVYRGLKDERLHWKHIQKDFEKQRVKVKDPASGEGYQAYCANEGLKIAINGSFGKLGSLYSILFAPEMLIQTTVTGQLAILLLIEWHEMQGISVISANTDGIIIHCERAKLPVIDSIIDYWQKTTGLELEPAEYAAIYSRDVNNYFAVKMDGEVKRKGEYSKAGLVEKKNPDVEICSDAVAEFLAHRTPIEYTIAMCRDIRKFVTVRKVTGGAVKLWGEGPRKEFLVRDMVPVLESNGWEKSGRAWTRDGQTMKAGDAYKACFLPQRPEYVGKVVRWYYSTQSPGPIVSNANGNNVSLSYGAKPCLILPDEFPQDIDYEWYVNTSHAMLEEIGYNDNAAKI
jgi:hypothetical protein